MEAKEKAQELISKFYRGNMVENIIGNKDRHDEEIRMAAIHVRWCIQEILIELEKGLYSDKENSFKRIEYWHKVIIEILSL